MSRNMAIRNITKAQFEAFNPACSPLATLISEEKEWYVADHGNILGIVLLDLADQDWLYI